MVLTNYFAVAEGKAAKLEKENKKFYDLWQYYYLRLPLKSDIINGLNEDNLKHDLPLLIGFAETDLAQITHEEGIDEDIIKDIYALKKAKRINRLDDALNYPQTRFEYLHELLLELHEVLKAEFIILRKLPEIENTTNLISDLKTLAETENHIVTKIKSIPDFRYFFLNLIKGEHIIKEMNARERVLFRRLNKIFTGESQEGVVKTWGYAVYDAIEETIDAHEEFSVSYNPHVDFEFVNRPEFVDLVREKLAEVRKRPISEQTVNIFVRIFREWYNHCRD